jgi:SPP1 family predicted phage head-tail adaptor
MRDRITFQTVTEAKDSYGGVVPTWSDYETVWASVEPLVGREFFAAKQTQADVTHKIRCRYLAGVTPKMRVVYKERIFNIGPPINIRERNHEMLLMATEVL